MAEPPQEQEPWERTLQLATVALGRGARVMLDMDTRDEMIAMLRAGQERADAEGRSGEYSRAGIDLVNGLVRAIQERNPRGSITEFRDRDAPQANISFLAPRDYRAALGSLCPGFWPFC